MEEEQGSKKVRGRGITDATYYTHRETTVENLGQKITLEFVISSHKVQEFIINAYRPQNMPTIPFKRKESVLHS